MDTLTHDDIRAAVRAREQRYFVTQSDQFIRKIGNNSLGPAIKPRRHALHKRRDLRNFHVFFSKAKRYGGKVKRECRAVFV